MRKQLSIFSIAACLIATSLSTHARIYRWVDENGKVNYTDTPPSHATIDEHKIKVPRRSSSAPGSKEKDATDKDENLETTAEKKQIQQDYIIPDPDPAKCEQAKSQIAVYTNTPRIRALVNGETKYLDEGEVAERLENWKTAKSVYCD